jgi:hypothetical protein
MRLPVKLGGTRQGDARRLRNRSVGQKWATKTGQKCMAHLDQRMRGLRTDPGEREARRTTYPRSASRKASMLGGVSLEQ